MLPVPGSNNANLAAQAGAFTLFKQLRRGRTFDQAKAVDKYLGDLPSCPLKKLTVPASEAPGILALYSSTQ